MTILSYIIFRPLPMRKVAGRLFPPLARRVLIVFLAGGFLASPATALFKVSLVTGNGAVHREIQGELQEHLSQRDGLEVRAFDLEQLQHHPQPGSSIGQGELVITIGTRAAQFMADQHADATVLSVLVTANSFASVQKKTGKHTNRFFGLLIDQPFDRFAALIRRLLPQARNISVSGLDSEAGLADATETANRCDLRLQGVQISQSENPIRLLDGFFSSSDVFVALPQPGAADRHNAKWILYTASRHRKPVIGFSGKYVTAGALASIYAAPSDIARETAEIIQAWQASAIPEQAWVRPGKRYSIKANPQVARYLRIDIPWSRDTQSSDDFPEHSEPSGCPGSGG